MQFKLQKYEIIILHEKVNYMCKLPIVIVLDNKLKTWGHPIDLDNKLKTLGHPIDLYQLSVRKEMRPTLIMQGFSIYGMQRVVIL